MKAEEIRELNMKMQEQILSARSAAGQDAGFKSFALSIVTEFVAQMAEMNDSLRKIANPPVSNEESPWVQLGWRGRRFVINRNDVAGVNQIGSSLAECVVLMRGDNAEEGGWAVEMAYPDLCAALHIPFKESA